MVVYMSRFLTISLLIKVSKKGEGGLHMCIIYWDWHLIFMVRVDVIRELHTSMAKI